MVNLNEALHGKRKIKVRVIPPFMLKTSFVTWNNCYSLQSPEYSKSSQSCQVAQVYPHGEVAAKNDKLAEFSECP